MIETIIVLAILLLTTLILSLLSLKKNVSLITQLKEKEAELATCREGIEKLENTITENNKQKERLNTGNPNNDADNATAIMSEYSDKIKTRRRVSSTAKSR